MKPYLFAVFVFLMLACTAQVYGQSGWQWGRGSTNGYNVEGYATATDLSGNVYGAGTIINSTVPVQFGTLSIPSTLFSPIKTFWIKYRNNGVPLWLGYIENSWLLDMATDRYNNLVLFGWFSGDSVSIGSITLVNRSTSLQKKQFFLAKYDSSGNLLWAINGGDASGVRVGAYGVSDIIKVGGVAVDSVGNIYITSSFLGNMTYGPYTLSNADASGLTTDMFIAKYTSAGLLQWATNIGGVGDDYSLGITVSAMRNVYVCGMFGSPSMTVGSSTISGNYSAFIAELSPSGTPLWGQASAGPRWAYSIGLVSDASGNVYMAGVFSDNEVKFGDTLISTHNSSFSTFVVQYTPENTIGWHKTIFAPGGMANGMSIAIAPCGEVWVTGNYDASAIVDSDTISLIKGIDPVFMAGYSLSGSVVGYSGLNSGGDDQNAISCDANGNVYLCSDFEQSALIVGSDTLPTALFESFYLAKYSNTFASNPNASFPVKKCPNGTIELHADSGFTKYVWNTGASIPSINIYNAGIYWVRESICMQNSTDTFNVFLYPVPKAGNIMGRQHICSGDTAQLEDSVTGGIWGINIGSGNFVTVTGLTIASTAGIDTIFYTVSDSNLCTNTAIKVLTVSPLPNVGGIRGGPNLCIGDSVQLYNSISGGVWESSNTNKANITTSGLLITHAIGVDTISYTVVGLQSCTNTSTKIMTIYSMPYAGNIFGNAVFCNNDTIQLTDSVTGGIWGATDTTKVQIMSAGVVALHSVGLDTIVYTVTNAGACTSRAIKAITINPLPSIGNILGIADVCSGNTIFFTDSIPRGIWSISNTAVAHIAPSGLVTTFIAGIDTIIYTVTDSMSCKNSALKVLTVNPLPDAGSIAGRQAVCMGDTAQFTDSIGGGAWGSLNTSIATVIPGGLVTTHITGIDTITYTVTTPFSCVSSVSAVVTVNSLPSPGAITGPNTLCPGALTALQDSLHGSWSSNNPVVASIGTSGTLSALSAGIAVITYAVTDSEGCTGMTMLTVNILPHALFTISGAVTPGKCYADTNASIAIAISGSMGPFVYRWQSGDTASAISGLVSGIYPVTVTETPTQCVLTDSFAIPTPALLVVTSDASSTPCEPGTGNISLTVAGGTAPYFYSWATGSTESTLSHLAAGYYHVVITDANGCFVSDSAIVKDSVCDIIVHNGFSPNGDGINETWIVEGIQNYPANKVYVFDKWGDLVFEKENYSNDWAGIGKNGKEVPDGTYYYLVKLNEENSVGGSDIFKGTLLIKR